ncbi:3-phenylpropionate/trans-cinnamate dioxygenase ferredoxin reductase subunit [Paracoccus alcaliphilus]|uniref:3-phenylpropionate/trans-cinnamate dioxygenase ferredoxin reductase subunit n=1 Tax=Paracoccus alcaliphilus TaxID=34002 RepID=A0A1H8LC39_9RHOB|nr:FAD-dependent oxidoreductase [Paracoccus alcaliphilus]WCR20180.1 FAD-dependent oxidoreductase [Paracoccus alcaliphilus]SEO02663.1 3-phenylpropionate/trans-cinnamate dioxygenase ferredoxin reductase subunit [Paracoccus alcaliphilus]
MPHIVVIGAGQAGAALVAKLRSSGFEGEITLIGAEDALPYQRPPLSKAYLLGELDEDRLWLRSAEYWAEQRITLKLGSPVTAIDPDQRTVTAGDEVLHYDELVLTTGSVPRRLPATIGGDLEGVYTVRTLADIDAMRAEFAPGRRLVVIGGGYIGLEAAAVGRKLGLDVSVVEMAPRILQRVAAPETSGYFRQLHVERGVQILENSALERLLGQGRVTAVRLQDGRELPADFVVTGVGILPATDLAQMAGAALDNGIRTDAKGRTSVPHIWAAGDCASFPLNGAQLRLESVGHAIDQAELVAGNILGADRDYIPKPWFWSDQYDCKLQIAGLNSGYDHVVVRPGANGAMSVWYYAGPQLLAVDAMNDPRAYMVGKRLIEAGKSADPALVADAETDLKTLIR